MNDHLIRSVASQLASRHWSWNRQTSMIEQFEELKWKLVEDVGSRKTFAVSPPLDVDAFFDDSRCLAIEINLDVFMHPENLTELEFEAKDDEFCSKFRRTTEIVSGVLGRPDYVAEAGDECFPEDQDAVWLSLWRFPACRLMVQFKHEDRELPMRICLVVSPPDREMRSNP